MACFVHAELHFCPCPRHKKCRIYRLKWRLGGHWGILLERSEYSVKVMGLVSLLLHCNTSNLVLEILKHDKIWGTVCINVPTPYSGGLVPSPPVICALVVDDDKTVCLLHLLLPTTLVVQVEQSVRFVCLSVSQCLCVRTIAIELNDLWPTYLVCWFTLTLSGSFYGQNLGQSSRSLCVCFGYGYALRRDILWLFVEFSMLKRSVRARVRAL